MGVTEGTGWSSMDVLKHLQSMAMFLFWKRADACFTCGGRKLASSRRAILRSILGSFMSDRSTKESGQQDLFVVEKQQLSSIFTDKSVFLMFLSHRS